MFVDARDTYIAEKLQQLVPTLAAFKDHKDRTIKRQYMSLLPALHISSSPDAPVFQKTVNWLLMNRLLKNDERAAAFDAVAELASMHPEMSEQAEQIFVCVKESLKPVPAKKNQDPCVREALRCPPGSPNQHPSLGVLYELVC